MATWAEQLVDDIEAKLTEWDYRRDDLTFTANLPLVAAFEVTVEGEVFIVKIEREK